MLLPLVASFSTVVLVPGDSAPVEVVAERFADEDTVLHAATGGTFALLKDTVYVRADTSRQLRFVDLVSCSVLVVTLTPPAEADSALLAKLGAYPSSRNGHVGPFGHLYSAPAGFVLLTDENASRRVSNRFTLGEFACHGSGLPQYVALSADLLSVLDALGDTLALMGLGRVRILSAFRSPRYNRRLGRAKLSRHMFGDAADVYVVGDDGAPADLNGDGRVSVADAAFLGKLACATLSSRGVHGGVGSYRGRRSHPPFVHVDTRGFDTDW